MQKLLKWEQIYKKVNPKMQQQGCTIKKIAKRNIDSTFSLDAADLEMKHNKLLKYGFNTKLIQFVTMCITQKTQLTHLIKTKLDLRQSYYGYHYVIFHDIIINSDHNNLEIIRNQSLSVPKNIEVLPKLSSVYVSGPKNQFNFSFEEKASDLSGGKFYNKVVSHNISLVRK